MFSAELRIGRKTVAATIEINWSLLAGRKRAFSMKREPSENIK
jgi:hypothetical protein